MCPDFFEDRTSYRTFQEVVDYIHAHFVCKKSVFRVWNKENADSENQRACVVIAYALRMWYTFKQTKALFGEHDHICLALPHFKKERNIYQINMMYENLLSRWCSSDVKLSDLEDFIDMPEDVLTLR